MKKLKAVTLAIAAAGLLASCGTSAKPEAKLIGSYISDAQLSYSNMRPTYNYYTTTYTFEVLDTYDDNTYCLTISSSTFSALILPEEGNAAQGNERDNSIWKFYGTYESKADDLDPDTLKISISDSTRVVATTDSGFFVDTENWTEDMKAKSADKQISYNAETGEQTVVGTTEYATGAEYAAAKGIKATELVVNVSSWKLDYARVR